MSVQLLRWDAGSSSETERRVGPRFPVEIYLTAYVEDRPRRGFTTDLSEQGLFLNSLRDRDVVLPRSARVGLELELPGIGETIWAAGEVCFDVEDDYFLGQGIRFSAMARLHARIIRHFCNQLACGPGERPPPLAI